MQPDRPLFWVVWSVYAVICLCYLGYRWNVRRKRGPLFPENSAVHILYRENFASGRSFKNILTRMGGARSCLKLTVTEDELWVTLWFPFDLLADIYDLEHRILKKNIVSLREEKRFLIGRRMIVAYTSREGLIREIELLPRHYDRFKQALQLGMVIA